MFNATNRAFPDVAALGHNYLVYLQAQIVPVDGTSCSSPVFGAIVALINAQRLKMGKRTLGFFTPAIYKAPANAWHDIVKGNNKCTESCCGAYGFNAAKGWVSTNCFFCLLFLIVLTVSYYRIPSPDLGHPISPC